MKTVFAKLMAHYLADEKGLVTVEWVGIAGVVTVAAILISAAVLESADLLVAKKAPYIILGKYYVKMLAFLK